MLSKIREFFSAQFELSGDYDSLTEHQRQLATAALLIEVATIDQEFDERELSKITQLLTQRFSLSDEEVTQLTDLARQESRQATSLYQFTALVNQHFSAAEKYELIKGMWLIAYADDSLDKYEEHVIRRVAELVHVSHSDFIRAKHDARAV